MAQRLDVGSGRHQVRHCDHAIEIIHRDRRRLPYRHGQVFVDYGVEIETAGLGFAGPPLNLVHDVCAVRAHAVAAR